MMYEYGYGMSGLEYGNYIGGGAKDDTANGNGTGDSGYGYGDGYGDGDGHGAESNDGNGRGASYEMAYEDGNGMCDGKENPHCTRTVTEGDLRFFICQQVMVGL